MKKKFVQIVFLALAVVMPLSFSTVFAAPGGEEYSGVGGQVMRVGIYYGDAGKQSIDLTAVTGDGFDFGYYDNDNTFVGESWTDSTQITVSAAFGIITVTNTATGETLYQTAAGSLGIDPFSMTGERTVVKCGYPYYGGFRFELFSGYGDQMTIVNMVRLDDYVKGVVPYEMSASWPIEALKVQAVCARTYALANVKTTHQRNFNFDLCDNEDCQVYRGVYSGSNADKVDQAVEETSGVVVTYDGGYCETFYSSSNGGASESAANVWGTDIPYLIGKEDPYEASIEIPDYHWSETFTGQEIQARLVKVGYSNCGVVTAVRIASLSGTGNVTALTFTDEYGKSYTLYGDSCRTVLSLRSLRYSLPGSTFDAGQGGTWSINGSESFDVQDGVSVISGDGTVSVISSGYVITASGVEEISGAGGSLGGAVSGSTFTFAGTGWGHNVGMSQYGAYAMANLGYTYQEILEFYYTGVTIGS